VLRKRVENSICKLEFGSESMESPSPSLAINFNEMEERQRDIDLRKGEGEKRERNIVNDSIGLGYQIGEVANRVFKIIPYVLR